MIAPSLAALALSASMSLASFNSPIHLHSHTSALDGRVNVTVVNKGFTFRDVEIDGHTYTVVPQHLLRVKAPAGTVIYAASYSPNYHRGDEMFELTPKMDNTRIEIN